MPVRRFEVNADFDIREPDPLKQLPIIDAEQADTSDDLEQDDPEYDLEQDDDSDDETFDDSDPGFLIKMPGKKPPLEVVYAGKVE